MELIRKPIHYTKEGKRIFDQFYLDEDYNVPDAKDDVQRIVMGNARVKTEETGWWRISPHHRQSLLSDPLCHCHGRPETGGAGRKAPF